MNERIQALAEQSGLEYNFDPMLWSKYEKFDEWIVRECADVILQWKSEPFPMDPEFAARLIKEHFGVEE